MSTRETPREAVRRMMATEPRTGKTVLAVLQNMWGPDARCPLNFVINPHNHSGRRLYTLIDGKARLRVTNAASLTTPTARGKRPTDLGHLQRALRSGEWALVLVCGKQAAEAIDALPAEAKTGLRFEHIDHPAARRWTLEKIAATKRRIAELLAENT